jgi:hypothetical protein
MTPAEFCSLSASEAAKQPPLLHALWHEAHGDWESAHSITQEIDTPEAARVHAYLHRKHGDHYNAHYWDRRAARLTEGKPFTGSLDEEWNALATFFLAL